MNLTGIRTAIAAAVATATGLTVSATVPDNVTPPMGVVGPDRTTYLTYDANTSTPNLASFIVTLITSRSDAATGQKALDDLLAGNVWTALTDPTLGGLCSYCQFTEARNPGPINWADVPYYGVDLVVEVQA